MSNSTDALFRAWVQFIEDTLVTTGGWTNTADTGQMTIATATHPAATNTKVGYRVYAMADALQATAPVFLRIDYGSASFTSGTPPAMWLTIGTGSNGAGTITGIAFNGGASTIANVQASAAATSACNSYGSADTARASFLLFVRAGAADQMVFTIERSKDATGADTGDGVLLLYADNTSSGVSVSQYVVRVGAQPPAEAGLSFLLSNRASSAFASDVAVGIPAHFKSIVQPLGINMIVVNDGDFLAQASVSFSLYGATRTYQLGDNSSNAVRMALGNAGANLRSNTRVGVRYD